MRAVYYLPTSTVMLPYCLLSSLLSSYSTRMILYCQLSTVVSLASYNTAYCLFSITSTLWAPPSKLHLSVYHLWLIVWWYCLLTLTLSTTTLYCYRLPPQSTGSYCLLFLECSFLLSVSFYWYCLLILPGTGYCVYCVSTVCLLVQHRTVSLYSSRITLYRLFSF